MQQDQPFDERKSYDRAAHITSFLYALFPGFLIGLCIAAILLWFCEEVLHIDLSQGLLWHAFNMVLVVGTVIAIKKVKRGILRSGNIEGESLYRFIWRNTKW